MSYEEIIERFKEAIAGINRKDLYVDILYDATAMTRVFKSRSEENFVVCPNLEGLVIRGYKGGKWREFGLQSLEDLDCAVDKLIKFNSPAKKPIQLREFETWNLNEEIKGELPTEDIPIDEKAEAVRAIFRDIQAVDDRVINPIVVYSDLTMERIFVNNEGCELRQLIPRTRLFLQPLVKEGTRVEYDYYSKSGEVGFELVKSLTGDEITTAVENSLALLKSEKP